MLGQKNHRFCVCGRIESNDFIASGFVGSLFSLNSSLLQELKVG